MAGSIASRTRSRLSRLSPRLAVASGGGRAVQARALQAVAAKPKGKKRPRPKPAKTANCDTPSKSFPHGTLDRDIEKQAEATGHVSCIGLDEAGRGPLAGPVVAGACFIPVDVSIEGINDSKKLDEAQREQLYEKITTHPRIVWATAMADNRVIDRDNILQASLNSMVAAFDDVSQQLAERGLPAPTMAFVDGNRMPKPFKARMEAAEEGGGAKQPAFEAQLLVKGDSRCFSIAAASVLAKVERDRIMVQLDKEYPQYDLAQHKGYPTPSHRAAVMQHGPSKIHRFTFAPIRGNWEATYDPLPEEPGHQANEVEPGRKKQTGVRKKVPKRRRKK